jgi:hypothetical protein
MTGRADASGFASARAYICMRHLAVAAALAGAALALAAGVLAAVSVGRWAEAVERGRRPPPIPVAVVGGLWAAGVALAVGGLAGLRRAA